MQQANKKQHPNKPPSQERKKHEKSSILWHFESMDRVNRAMQGTNDLEQMMKDVLDALLSVFACDRAWLVYACDPDSPTWQVSMERTRPEYPGALPIGIEMPLTPSGAEVFRNLRAANGPVQFGAGLENEVDPDMRQNFRIQSYIAMALYPKIGKPWSFGLHQCSHSRVWTPEEERLFQEIGRRLSDTLTSLLAFRNLRESEEQIKQLINASPVAMVVSSGIEQRVEWVNEKFIELFGYTSEDLPDVEHWWPLAYPDEAYRAEIRARWETSVEKTIRERGHIQPMEATVWCKDGSQRHIEFRLSSIGEKNLVTFIDLTERKQVENALHERERHSQSLLRLSRRLEQAQTYSDVLNAAQDEVRDAIGYQNLWAYLFTPDKKQAKALFAKGPMSDMVMSEDGTATLRIQGDRMMEEFVETKEILVVEDAQTDERTDKKIVARMGNRTLINVPILLFDRHLGSVGMGTFGNEGVRIPTASEREYLTALASHMAVSFDRIHLLDERRQSEQALRENEEKFRTLIEQSAEGVMLADENGTIVEWNYASERMTGLERSQVLGQPLWDVMAQITARERATPERRESIQSDVLEALRSGKSYLFDAPMEMEFYPLPGKEKHYFHQTVFRIKTEMGYRIASLIEDITEHKQMTDALAEREREFRTLAEYSPDNIARYDVNCRTIYVNPTLERTLGRPASEMLGTLPAETGFIKEAKEYQEKMVEVLKTGKEKEMNLVLPDMGEGLRYHNIRFVAERGADGAITGIQAIGRDLTEHKQIQDALWKSSQMLKLVLDNMPVYVFWKDRNSVYLGCNNLFAANAGLDSPEKLIGLTDLDLPWKHTEAASYRADDRMVMESGLPKFNYEETQRTAEGRIMAVRVSKIPLRNPTGEVIGVLGTFEDITERKRTEAALQESEERLRQITSSLREVVWLRDAQTRQVLYVNPAFQELTGRTCESFYENRDIVADAIYPDDREDVTQALDQRSLSAPFDKEHRIIHLNGSVRWVSSKSFAVRNKAGEVYRWATIMEDITERKLAEAALRESEKKFRGFVESSSEGFTLVDEQGAIIEWNPAREKMTGLPANQVLGQKLWDVQYQMILPKLRTPEFYERFKQILLNALQTGQSPIFNSVMEAEVIHPSNLTQFIQQTVFPIKTDKGYRIGSVTSDITERKLAERALQESEEKYRLLHENAGVGIGYYTPDGQIISYNQVAASHMQGKPEDFEGRFIYEVFPREEAEFYMGRIRKSLETESALEYEDHLELPSGEKWFLSIFTKIRDAQQIVTGVQIISHDITEQKQAEESLRESERRLVAAQYMAHVGYWERDFDTNRVALSDEACRIFGIAEHGLSLNLDEWHARWVALIHPEDQPRLIKLLDDVLAGTCSYEVEYRVVRPDGVVRFVYSQADVKRDASGRARNMLGMMQDITDRKQAEQALRASENRFRVLSENAFVGIYIIQDGRLSYVNSTLAKIFGYTPEELTGAEPALVIHPDDQAMVAENIRRRIVGEIETIHYEFRGRCKDGETKNIEVLGGRIDFSGKTAVIGNLMDITGRKRADDEIARSLAAEKKARQVAEILREANESLSRTLHLDDVLQNLLQYLVELVPYDSANVMLREGDFHFRVVALRGYERWTDHGAAQKLVFDIRTIPSLRELVAAQKSTIIANTYAYPGWQRVPGTEHVVSWMGIPLIADGQVIGLYSVDRVEPASFTDEHRFLAEGLAAQAAVAIQNTRLHDQITSSNVELEQRVASRTAQLEEANKELEAFAYSVSHDLRAPLRHIDGFIELLQKRMKTTLDDKSQHYMDVIADSARKMGTLIDDLLSFSRMGRKEMFTSRVDLNELIQDIVREAKPETTGRNIQWKISSLPPVTGDQAMLRMVLVNLIANALKFTNSRKVAQIEIGYKDHGNEIVIFVRDNGVGFDMRYGDNLFGVFQRLHRQEDFEGTGNDLANVRRIINRHGGRTWAEGVVDQGATFYFSLPISKQEVGYEDV